MDDLVVDARTPGELPEAAFAMPDSLPSAATPAPGKVEAEALREDTDGVSARERGVHLVEPGEGWLACGVETVTPPRHPSRPGDRSGAALTAGPFTRSGATLMA